MPLKRNNVTEKSDELKILYLVRGLPGSGKSTFVKTMGVPYYEADMYFVDSEGKYVFDPKNIKAAHLWCQNSVRSAMVLGVSNKIAVSNTFTQQWEIDPYIKMAKDHGYNIFSIVVENRHGNPSVHGVPEQNMDAMEKRFEVKLR